MPSRRRSPLFKVSRIFFVEGDRLPFTKSSLQDMRELVSSKKSDTRSEAPYSRETESYSASRVVPSAILARRPVQRDAITGLNTTSDGEGTRQCKINLSRRCSQQESESKVRFEVNSAPVLCTCSLSPLDSAGSFFGQSSFARHALVQATSCVKVTQDVDRARLAALAPLGCGLGTG